MITNMHDNSQSIINQSNTSKLNHQIPDILDGVEGEAIDVVCDEPLENPHRFIKHQSSIEVVV